MKSLVLELLGSTDQTKMQELQEQVDTLDDRNITIFDEQDTFEKNEEESLLYADVIQKRDAYRIEKDKITSFM